MSDSVSVETLPAADLAPADWPDILENGAPTVPDDPWPGWVPSEEGYLVPADQSARVQQQVLSDLTTALVAQLVGLPVTPTPGALRCPVTDETIHPRLVHVHGDALATVALASKLSAEVMRIATQLGAVRLYATPCQLYPVHNGHRPDPRDQVHQVELACGWAVRLPDGSIRPLATP